MIEKGVVVKSFAWTAVETYATQGIAFIVSIFMARILMPSDYGIIGIIGVFLALSDIFIDAGFTNALINKKDCSKADYSTVFIINIAVSILFFALLFFASPFIARFYNNPQLLWTTRVMALTFVISSFGAVSMTILVKELRFRAKAVITLIVSVISGCIGIFLAYRGWGVWALVWQSVLSCLVRVLITIIYVRWRPSWRFNKTSFKELFKFGSNLLGSNIIFTLYNNIYALVIGKVFNTTDLGYFSRADGYSKLIPTNVSGVLGKILFPILSKIKDNDKELIELHHKFIVVTSVVLFPSCLFLAGLSAPIVFLLITSKWMPIVPLLQILCIAGIFEHFTSINGNFIIAKGKANFFLRMHIFTKPPGLIILAVTVLFNLQVVAWGKVLYSIICLLANYYYLKKTINIRIVRDLIPLGKLLIIAGLLSAGSMELFRHIAYSWLNLFWVLILMVIIYIAGIYFFCSSTFNEVRHMLFSRKLKSNS